MVKIVCLRLHGLVIAHKHETDDALTCFNRRLDRGLPRILIEHDRGDLRREKRPISQREHMQDTRQHLRGPCQRGSFSFDELTAVGDSAGFQRFFLVLGVIHGVEHWGAWCTFKPRPLPPAPAMVILAAISHHGNGLR